MACEHKRYIYTCEECGTHGMSRRVGVPRLTEGEAAVIDAHLAFFTDQPHNSDQWIACMHAADALRAERVPQPRFYDCTSGYVRDEQTGLLYAVEGASARQELVKLLNMLNAADAERQP